MRWPFFPKRPNQTEILLKQVITRLDVIYARLGLVAQGEQSIMADLSALQAEVERADSVDQSIVTLLEQIASQLEAAKTDPAAIQALVDQLREDNDAIVAAVTANTPSA